MGSQEKSAARELLVKSVCASKCGLGFKLSPGQSMFSESWLTKVLTPLWPRTFVSDIVEVSDAQSAGDEPIPDVPAEFTGEVSGFTDNSPEAINAESAQVEGEAGEEQPSVDTEVEVEAAIEPSPRRLAELRTPRSKPSPESLAEEVVGACDFGVVEEGTVFTDAESPAQPPRGRRLSSEMEAQVPVAPARDSHVPESRWGGHHDLYGVAGGPFPALLLPGPPRNAPSGAFGITCLGGDLKVL
ncbi:hypothetical protein Nepgr_022310 [Nepenthes gracilis]|uniref:Uncharacterized protein n=1 Tax=Nepenthes gracilis TaxID=150966 RepID=A0AAD3T0H9_NEPGR|nr:hypothetical protein Nepgr_022310 [Nepenthes gracilis]